MTILVYYPAMHPEGTGGGPELSTYEVYVCIFPLTEFITSYFAILPEEGYNAYIYSI